MPALAKEQMIRLSTGVTPFACPICQYTTYGGTSSAFNDVCNHILLQHKLSCLHVGQETHARAIRPGTIPSLYSANNVPRGFLRNKGQDLIATGAPVARS